MTATGEAEARHGECAFDRLLLVVEKIVGHLGQHFLGALRGRARRRNDLRIQDALILVGQERFGNAREQQGHQADDDHEHNQVAAGVVDHVHHAAFVLAIAAREVAVEPTEEAAFLVVFLSGRLEEGSAQRRSEDQRDQHRQRHGRHHGDGKLSIDYAGRPAE